MEEVRGSIPLSSTDKAAGQSNLRLLSLLAPIANGESGGELWAQPLRVQFRFMLDTVASVGG